MNNSPNLRPALCAFIDILGFSDSIMDAYESDSQNAVFSDVFSALTESTKRITSAGSKPSMITVKMFTDNIVIVYENSFVEIFRNLMHLCELIADYQLAMACRGYFIRGAISMGTIAVDDRIVFGDALIKAHRLEFSKARNPRVILDFDLVKLAEEHLIGAKDIDKSTWRMRIMKDVDGLLFVNYLVEAYVPVPHQGRRLAISEPILEQHRDQVTTNLSNMRSHPHIWTKYFWTANYHNAFCDQSTQPNIKIDPSCFQVQPLIIK